MVLPSSGTRWLETALRACAEVRVTVQMIPEAFLTLREGDPAELPFLTVVRSKHNPNGYSSKGSWTYA